MTKHSRFQVKTSRSAALLTMGALILGLAPAPSFAQATTDRGMGLSQEAPDDVMFAVPPGVNVDKLSSGLDASLRIVGGTPAHVGKWPSMVAIYFINKTKGEAFLCGGTVISSKWVLTAAHCANIPDSNNTWEVRVVEGTVGNPWTTGHAILAATGRVHPDYSKETLLNDVALLELAEPAKSPPQKLLGEAHLADELKAGRMSTVIGFGRVSEKGKPSERLLQVDVPLVTQKQCQEANSQHPINDAKFCAGYPQGGKDSCYGDSGGPLYITDKSGAKIQAGVVSYGEKGCAQPNGYGVYASVGHFESWIKSFVHDAEFNGPSAQTPTGQAAEGITPAADLNPAPGEQAQVSIDVAQGHTLKVGSFVDVRVLSSIGGQLVVFNQNPDGKAYQLYPSKIFPAPGTIPDNALIDAGKTIAIPSAAQKAQGYRFAVRPPFGINHLYAIVVPKGGRVADLVQRHYAGEDISDLGMLLNDLVDAEKSDRGIEPVRVPPTSKGTGEFTYEIVQ